LREPFHPDPSELELVRHVVETLGESHFIAGRTSIELRDAASFIGRGPVDGTFPEAYGGLMMDVVDFSLRLADDRDFVKGILSAATDRAIEVALALVEAGVDAIFMDTDYCHQTGPWISPHDFEEIVLPLLQRQVDAIHSAGAYVIKYTDGKTWPILDMLVSTGIDGLHGIQPSVGMDIKGLKETVGDRVALFGAVEGKTLINRRPEVVEREVEHCLRYGAPGGGFVLTTSNSVQAGTKYENYMKMLQVAREKEAYPIALGSEIQ
jgi:uroporphyrinogen decarboxylase